IEILKGANANMALGDPGENGTGQNPIAEDMFASGHCGKTAAGGHPQGGHGFADNVFPQHRTQWRATIPHARKGSLPRPLELDVITAAIFAHHFTEEDGATVPELRIPAAKLVAGIGAGDGICTHWNLITGE